MTDRFTVKHVRAAFDDLLLVAGDLGMDTTHWAIQEGSSANGQTYRLFLREPGGHTQLPITGDRGYLGLTARDAYVALTHFTWAFRAVRNLMREPNSPLMFVPLPATERGQ